VGRSAGGAVAVWLAACIFVEEPHGPNRSWVYPGEVNP